MSRGDRDEVAARFEVARQRLRPLVRGRVRAADARTWRRLEEAIALAIEDREAAAAEAAFTEWLLFARRTADNRLAVLGVDPVPKPEESVRT